MTLEERAREIRKLLGANDYYHKEWQQHTRHTWYAWLRDRAAILVCLEEQADNREYFKETLPVFQTLFYFLLGLLLFGWGWFRWKGLYYYPDGLVGYILASIACIIGVIVWWYGIPWSKAF